MKKARFIGKIALAAVALMTAATPSEAQNKGKFEVYDFDNFKLHVYYTNDAMGDASYIVEGDKGLVTLEAPLFKDNCAEFDAYANKLGKDVVQIVSDYHLGGSDDKAYAMPEGMPAFVKGPVYGGMMKGFAQMFGEAIVSLPTGNVTEVPFGNTVNWAGVDFKFNHGASTDFPGAAILIGGKVYLTHWCPAKAHANVLNIASTAAVDAEIAAAESALASGAELFIGCHGGAAQTEALQFRRDYLKTVKRLLAENKDAASFASALKSAYPNLAGEEGVDALAQALYK